MTATLEDVTKKKEPAEEPAELQGRRAPACGGNVRNGTRSKTVLTEASGHLIHTPSSKEPVRSNSWSSPGRSLACESSRPAGARGSGALAKAVPTFNSGA
jgi:hypothetical protein